MIAPPAGDTDNNNGHDNEERRCATGGSRAQLYLISGVQG